MVLYGERFDYSKTQLTEEQKRVARCRAEAARKGREQARRWRAKKNKAAHGQDDAPVLEHPACEANKTRHETAKSPQFKAPMTKLHTPEYSHSKSPTDEYYLGRYYTGEYFDGESLTVQFIAGELCEGEFPVLQLITGQFQDDQSTGQFLLMREPGPAD